MDYKQKLISGLVTVILGTILTACGGSDSSGNGKANESIIAGTNGKYDLSRYVFPKAVLKPNSEANIKVRTFKMKTGEKSLDDFDKKYTSDDGIVIKEYGYNEITNSYQIKSSTIYETVFNKTVSKSKHSRTHKRFVDVGTTYLNSNIDVTLGNTTLPQNGICIVKEHLDSFNIANATGKFNLASGVYNDVLVSECTTGYKVDGVVAPHSKITHYHVKDIGLVLSKGLFFIAGELYVIEELQ